MNDEHWTRLRALSMEKLLEVLSTVPTNDLIKWECGASSIKVSALRSWELKIYRTGDTEYSGVLTDVGAWLIENLRSLADLWAREDEKAVEAVEAVEEASSE